VGGRVRRSGRLGGADDASISWSQGAL